MVVVNLRMSSLGSCLRAQVAGLLDYKAMPTPDAVQLLYDRGNTHETDCLAALRAEFYEITNELDGYGVDDGQVYLDEQVAGVRLTGHLDGVIREPDPGSRWRVLEIKAPSTWHSFERAYKTASYDNPYMNRIAWQVSAYMVFTGMECQVACVEDGRVKMFDIETPIYTREDIEARVAEIQSWVQRGELPGERSQIDWPCPFAYLHAPDVVTEIDDPELAEKLRAYDMLNAQKNAADKVMKQLRSEMVPPGLGKFKVSGVPRTWYETTRTTLDKDAMVRDGIDLSKYETTTTTIGMR